MLLCKLYIQRYTEIAPCHAGGGGALLCHSSSAAHSMKCPGPSSAQQNHKAAGHERTSSSPTLGKSLHFRLSSLPCFLLSEGEKAGGDPSAFPTTGLQDMSTFPTEIPH